MISWRKHGPAMMAGCLVVLGMRSFFQRYPFGFQDRAATRPVVLNSEQIPEALQGGFAHPESDTESASVPDPFRLRALAPTPATVPKAPPKPLPARKWVLKGTAGESVATLLDSTGTKRLMRVGDVAGPMRVLEIHANRVVLQDAAGRFELNLER